MKRVLGEQVVVEAHLVAVATFKPDARRREVVVFAREQHTARTIESNAPTRNVFRTDTEAHAHTGLTHERVTGTHTHLENQTVLEPVTTAQRVRVFVQALFLFELLAGSHILLLGSSQGRAIGFSRIAIVIIGISISLIRCGRRRVKVAVIKLIFNSRLGLCRGSSLGLGLSRPCHETEHTQQQNHFFKH